MSYKPEVLNPGGILKLLRELFKKYPYLDLTENFSNCSGVESGCRDFLKISPHSFHVQPVLRTKGVETLFALDGAT